MCIDQQRRYTSFCQLFLENICRRIGNYAQGNGKCQQDRKSTRLNSSHLVSSYAVFCLKKKKTHPTADEIFKALSHNHKNMSVATVYNNLKLFKDTGLVTELTYDDESSRFDFKTTTHY